MVIARRRNGVIGADGDIPWRIPEDFAHFKAITDGPRPGDGPRRRTTRSAGPLPGRTTVVVTRDPDWSADGVLVAHSLEEALAVAAERPGETYVAGGTQLYEQALPLATHQVLTEVHLSPDGDAHYPAFDTADWVETRREPRDGFAWVWWERTGNRDVGAPVQGT